MIPAELVDHIFSFLHSDEDYTTLKTCSLFLPQIADRHLYSCITVATDPVHHQVLDFYAKRTNAKRTYMVDPTHFSHLVVDRPHIANCVRVLRIIAETNYPGVLPVISSILSKLSQIESIAFRSRGFLPWLALDPAFRTALRNSIRLPSIKQIAVSEITGFPLDTFYSCKNLRSLLLYGYCTSGVSASASSYPRLHSLCIDNKAALSAIVPWMKCNTLHTLSLCIHELDGLPKFWALIDACSTSLVSLELDHKCCDPPWETPVFDKLQLPLLEHIIFRSPVLMPIYESCLPLFVFFLGSIQTKSSLSLTLHLQFQRCFLLKESLVPDWSFIMNFLLIPNFRHPIKLHIDQSGMDPFGLDVPSSLGEHPDLRRMLADGQLVIIIDEDYSQDAGAR